MRKLVRVPEVLWGLARPLLWRMAALSGGDDVAESPLVAIVGGGPAGAVAALEACRAGLGPVWLFEREEAGRPKACGGGLSPRARKVLQELGLWERVHREAYGIEGMRLVAPSGREAVLAGAESASVLPRQRFDAMLLEEAARAGALIRCRSRVMRVTPGDREILLEVEGRERPVRAPLAIVAGGARSPLRGDGTGEMLLTAVMGWWEGVPHTPHLLEMIFDPALRPHYGWLFPEGDGRVNIGICLRQDRLEPGGLRRLFQDFLDRHYRDRLAGARLLGAWRGHPIRTSVRVGHRAPEGILVIGEANGLVDPATGEGIAQAMQSGRLAVRAIRQSLDRGEGAAGASRRYARALQREFATAFRVADWFQRRGTGLLDGLAWFAGLPGIRTLGSRALARL